MSVLIFPELSRYALYAAAVWPFAVALLMAWRPRLALQGLDAMGSTPLIHFGEHLLRGLAGLALIGVSGAARYPEIFFWAGAFIVGTSVLIALAPRRWHHAYAQWWAKRIPPVAVRAMAPIAVAAGLALIWAVAV
jgi:hypothetical protein